jgi:hypothetical protein
VRGGLDEALDKLARRDELRRRAAGEATGTPPAVQELAEAIAAVVGRNPKLAVTVGVEGAGDPVLLHFLVEEGVVQVSVDNSVASRVAEATPTSPKHADFDIELDEPEPAFPAAAAEAPTANAGQESRRISYDDRDRFDPGTGYATSTYGEPTEPTTRPSYADDAFYADAVAPDRRYERHRRYDDDFTSSDFFPQNGNGGSTSHDSAFPPRDDSASPAPHPFAATPPPPVPPQTSRPAHAEQHRAPEEPAAAQRGMPTSLPQPIPLKVDSEETELAAKRLAALLRDNPSLLQQSPLD